MTCLYTNYQIYNLLALAAILLFMPCQLPHVIHPIWLLVGKSVSCSCTSIRDLQDYYYTVDRQRIPVSPAAKQHVCVDVQHSFMPSKSACRNMYAIYFVQVHMLYYVCIKLRGWASSRKVKTGTKHLVRVFDCM